MSFLASLLPAAGAAGTAGGATATAAASGLGKLIGADPSRISAIAGNIGKGMNGIAAAGGANQGYQDPGLPQIQNHMQLLDPAVIQALIAHFNGGGTSGVRPVSY